MVRLRWPSSLYSPCSRATATAPATAPGRPPPDDSGVLWVSGCGLNLRPTSGRLVRPPTLQLWVDNFVKSSVRGLKFHEIS